MNEIEKKAVLDFISKNYHDSDRIEIKMSGASKPFVASLKILLKRSAY